MTREQTIKLIHSLIAERHELRGRIATLHEFSGTFLDEVVAMDNIEAAQDTMGAIDKKIKKLLKTI